LINKFKPVLSEQRIHDMQAPCGWPRLSGSGLPWPPARSLRLGERDSFEYAWVTLNRCDPWNKGTHIWSRSGPGVQYSRLKKPHKLVSVGACLQLVINPFDSMGYDGHFRFWLW